MKSLSVSPLPSFCDAGGNGNRKSLATTKIADNKSIVVCHRQRSLRSSSENGNMIRSRLLTKLGIVQPQPQERARAAVAIRKIVPFSVPLKFNDEDNNKADDDTHDSTSKVIRESPGEENEDPQDLKKPKKTVSKPLPPRKSVVAFDNEVSVVPIPKHQEYSNRIRNSLWSGKHELRYMAARNTLEYQAEGWHPSTVVEDEGMIQTSTGELIHPVHLHRLLSSPFFRLPMKVTPIGCQHLETSRKATLR